MKIIEIWRSFMEDKMLKAFEVALGEYDVTEWSSGHNPEVMKYFHETGFSEIKSDEISWCSAFACWCNMKAGMSHPKSLVARDWLSWGDEVFEPKLGDITVFWRNDPKGWQGHVGRFIRQNGSRIWVLGGNQSNKVCIDDYSGGELLGYRRWEM